MQKTNFFTRAFLLLASLLPLSSWGSPMVLPKMPAPKTTGTVNLPTVTPMLGPLKLGLQFNKRPSAASAEEKKTQGLKDVGFGVKFSLAI